MAALRQTSLCTSRCNSGICYFVVTQSGHNLLRCDRFIAAAAVAALRQTSLCASRCNSDIRHLVVSQGGHNFLRCGRFITAAAMAALCQARFSAGRRNGGVRHHIVAQCRHNLLRRDHFIAAATMAALRQTSLCTSRCNSGIRHLVVAQGGHNLLRCSRPIAAAAMAPLRQARLRASRRNGGIRHHVMSQGIHIVLLDHIPAGTSPQCIALLGTSRRHNRVLILVAHVGHHNAVDGEPISTVALVRHQPDRQRISADSKRLACQLRPGVLRPVHIEVVDICFHLSLRRECHIQGKCALCLVGIGLIQIILIIMAGLRVALLVQCLGLFLMYINLQLRRMPLIGNIDHLFPSRGHVIAAQLQQAGIIRDRLHAAIFMGQRHADAACVQRTIRQICSCTDFAGNIRNRRIAISMPLKITTAFSFRCRSPCLILIWIKCTYIEVSKSSHT